MATQARIESALSLEEIDVSRADSLSIRLTNEAGHRLQQKLQHLLNFTGASALPIAPP